ncbi:MAG: EAL domain-containing protein [Emcibacteraceae bacterium]|nr:EAL domain-containing protein [Emcibacteraceae bacterium]
MGDFRKSLEAGHVKFYYQPKINLEQNKITHVEVLVRWIHPERGFIPPDDFIMMAEQTGHIKHLTDWGIEKVIKQSRDFIDEDIDIKIAINLSARDLSNKRLPEYIIGLLEQYKVPRSRLVLEITESAIMKDPELAMGVLNSLDAHGLLMSIDDYGTGYSSMSYLKQLPIKELKVDKSFVLDLATNKEDEILVRSTIELGHNLGLKVTAEGVEDQISLEKLRSYGCDLIQGYHVSRPLPIADLYDFIKNSPYGLNDKVVETQEAKIRVLKS